MGAQPLTLVVPLWHFTIFCQPFHGPGDLIVGFTCPITRVRKTGLVKAVPVVKSDRESHVLLWHRHFAQCRPGYLFILFDT